MYKIEAFEDSSIFLTELRDFDISNNPYQSYAYYSIYMQYYNDFEYRFFRATDENNHLRALLPFYCYKKMGSAELLRFIGYGQFNYEGYICSEDDVFDVHNSFVDFIKKNDKHYVIDFFDINSSSKLYDILTNTMFKNTSIQLYGCPLVDFKEPNFDEFFKTAFPDSKKRSELKKFQRKLGSIGKIEVINMCGKDSYQTYFWCIPYLYDIFARRFSDVYATSFFSSQSMRSFYDDLIKSLVEQEKGFISILLLDSIPIAFIFCVANQNTLIDWIPAFDPAFSKYNLGTVQYKMLFEKLYEQGKYRYFDFSKGSSVYKRKWSKNETSNWQFIINYAPKGCNTSLLYILYCSFYKFKTWMRNHGLNNKIKHMIGVFQRGKSPIEENKLRLSFIDDNAIDKTEQQVPYSKWAFLTVSEKTKILESIYSGYFVNKIEYNQEMYDVTMIKS